MNTTNTQKSNKYLININIIKNNGIIGIDDIPDFIELIKNYTNVAIGNVVILSGRMPIWLYGILIHYFHPTKALAVFEPRMNCGIVIASHDKNYKIGDLIYTNDCEKIDINF